MISQMSVRYRGRDHCRYDAHDDATDAWPVEPHQREPTKQIVDS